MKLFRTSLIPLFLLMSSLVYANSIDSIPFSKIKLQLLTINQGLSQGMITSIIQDHKGFLWLGTKDGLNKYDGYSFKIYRHSVGDPYSLSENHIFNIVCDNNGLLWILFNNGDVDVFDPVNEKVFHLSKTFPALKVKNELQFYRAIVHGGAVYIGNGAVFTKIVLRKNSSTNKFPYDFHLEDQTGAIGCSLKYTKEADAYITSNGKTFLSHSGKICVFKTPDDLKITSSEVISVEDFSGSRELGSSTYRILAEDTIRSRFAGEVGGIVSIHDARSLKRLALIDLNFGIPDLAIRKMCFDGYGRLWIVSFEAVFLFDPSTNNLVRIVSADPTITVEMLNYINTAFCDRSGVMWLGTSGFGLIRYNYLVERFHHVSGDFGSNNVAQGIWESVPGELFIKFPSGISKYNVRTGKISAIRLGSVKDCPVKINPGSPLSGDCFLPVNNGFWHLMYPYIVFLDKSFNIIHCLRIPNSENPMVGKTFEDRKGRVWMATGVEKNFYLYLIDEKSDTILKSYAFPVQSSTISYPFTSAIQDDDEGNLWIGTVNGLYKFNTYNGSWTNWKSKENDTLSLPQNIVFSICNDPNEANILWVGTNGGGLVRFNRITGRCEVFNNKNGLPNNVIYGILSDADGHLWLSTNLGIARFDLKTHLVRSYTVKDGLQSNEFNRYAYCKLINGQLVFGGMNGFNVFDPKTIAADPFQPNINFTGLRLGNLELALNQSSGLLTDDSSKGTILHLNHKQNFITFSFASDDYKAVDKLQYAYKMEGLDDDWQMATKRNEATYTNLSPGTYTFRVRGTNSDELWSARSASMQIIIDPPWWGTWWFRSIALLLIFTAVYSLYRYRLRSALKLLSLRNRIASDLHDEIGSTLSSISLYSEAARRMVKDNPGASKLMERINTNTTEVMESMSDIVWAINSRNDKLDNLMNRMRSFAVQISEARSFQLHFAENKDLPDMPLDMYERRNLYLIFKEAINNSAKYSNCKNLWVSFYNVNRVLEMRVKDDGCGFAYEEKQGESNIKQGGNGLLNMKKRALELGGSVNIHTSPGVGTEIILRFRL